MKALEVLRRAGWALLPMFLCFLLAVLGAGMVVVSLDTHQLITDADRSAQHVDALLTRAELDYRGDQQSLAATLDSAAIASRQAALFALEEREQLRRTAEDSDKTVKATRVVIDRAGLLLRHADEQLSSEGGFLPSAQQNFADAMQAFAAASKQMETELADPHVAELSANLAETSGNLARTTASGAHVAKYYEDKLTKPASLAKTIAKGALDIGSKLGSVLAGFLKF